VTKMTTYRVGGLLAATTLGAVLVPAAPAGAAEGFSCPTGTDAVEVPYAWDGYTPLLAGTVCVVSGATQHVSVHIEPGWTAKVKSDGTGSSARTDVRFTQTITGDRVELIYEPGLLRIK
jgi:hypothetical protein